MEETKLYKIDTKFTKSHTTEYMTTIVYGTLKRVQEKQKEAVEKILSDCGSMPYLGIHIKSEVTPIEDVVVTLSSFANKGE